MSNKELLDIMREQFGVITESIVQMEQRVSDRFDGIDKELKLLSSYKDQQEGSMAAFKYLVGIGFSVLTIVITLITIYLKGEGN